MANPKSQVSGVYWSTVAKFLGWCAALMTLICVIGVVLEGRAREGNAIGALIFGAASFLLLKGAQLIRVPRNRPSDDNQVMGQPAPDLRETSSPSSSQRLGLLAVVASLSAFIIAISGLWVAHELPSSGFVLPIAFVGMSIVGAVCGFLVSGVANITIRLASPIIRVPLTAVIWVLFCAFIGALLIHVGDQKRLLALLGVAGFWGLLIGPYNAELFVTAWFVKRRITG